MIKSSIFRMLAGFCAVFVAGLLFGAEKEAASEGDSVVELEWERFHTGPHEKNIGYAQAVKVGRLIYVSGTTARGANLEDQLKSIYIRIQSTLGQYGVTMSNIVKETVFTTDIEALKAAIPARKIYYPNEAYPAATWVQVERLYRDEFLVEVEVVAVDGG